MLKKLTLLAMAVGALTAFAAPSMAGAAEWYTSGVKVGTTTATGDAVHFTGTLSSTKSGVKITCEATANATLWNQGGVGVGEATLTLSGLSGTGACTVAVFVSPNYVDVCDVNPSSTGINWPLTTTGTSVAIANANFTNEFIGCEATLGIPDKTKLSDEGTATGKVVGECIVFNAEGDFKGGSTVDGSLCPTTKGLELK